MAHVGKAHAGAQRIILSIKINEVSSPNSVDTVWGISWRGGKELGLIIGGSGTCPPLCILSLHTHVLNTFCEPSTYMPGAHDMVVFGTRLPQWSLYP